MRPILTLLAAVLSFIVVNAQNPVVITMCSGTQASSTSAATGTVFDSGGPFNQYQNGEYCTLLINPACAVNLSITFQEFSVENCCDPMYVYDGDSENAPLLGDVRFATIPVTYTPTSGKLFLRWSSDGSAVSSGYRATWTSTLVNPAPPEATVNVSNATPAFQESIQFQASSSNYPQIWAWDFGDGQTSLEQNPEHTYQSSGQYTARLIVTNCHALSDTVTTLVTVQELPTPALNPAALALQAACSETARGTFTLHNEGAGDLLFSARAESVLGRRNVLIYGYLANASSLEGVQSALANFPTMFEVFNTQASDNDGLAQALQGMDLLLVPELPSWLDPWGLMAQMPAIQQFIQNGGGIVVCGSYYYSHFLSASNLLLVENNNFYTTEFSYSGLPFTTPHPIVDEMPLVYFAPYFTGALNIIDPDYTSLCSLNGQSIVGYKPVDAGRLVYLGFNFQSPDNDLQNLLKNALRWANLSSSLTVQPNSGRVAPGDSLVLELAINTEEVTAGNYAGSIVMSVNHPVNPELSLPFNLNITGQAVVQPQSNQLDFADLMQLRTETQPFVIRNPGCDTLFITNISFTNPVFTTNKTELTIQPFEEDTMIVSFAPVDTGLFQGTLVLQTATGQTDIQVSGRGLGAPIIHISPSSLEATLNCGDSTVLHLTIENAGLGDLTIARKFGSINSPGTRILILDQLAYYSSIPYQISNQILAEYPSVEVVHYNGSGSFSDLPDFLAGADVVILPALGGGPNDWYVTIGEYLRPFVNSGGFVLMTGTPYSAPMNSLGLINAQSEYYNTNSQRLIPLLQHPLLENVVPDALVYDEAWSLIFDGSSYINVARSEGVPVGTSLLGYQNIGSGTVAYLGYEYEYFYQTSNRVLINALKWGGSAGWLQAPSDTVVVAPGTSTELDIEVDVELVAAGVYQSELMWTTNDPLTPLVSVPVNITVQGEPELNVPQSSLNFGIIQQFSQKTETIEVSNLGCDTLHVLSFTSNNTAYVIAADNPTVVLPFSTASFKIIFAPQTPGGVVGTLTLNSDGGDKILSVTGLAVGAPIVSATPNAVEIDLDCEDVFSTQLNLQNMGLGNLNYQIGQSPNHRIALFNVYANYWRLNAIQSQLTALYPAISLSIIQAGSAADLADSLAKVDILVIPSLEVIESAYYSSYKPVIQSFLENGGLVFVLGVYYYQPLIQLGLFNQMDFYSQGFMPVELLLPSHQIADGVDNEFAISDNFASADFPQTEGVTTILRTKQDKHTYLGVKSRGLGQVVFWGNNFDSNLSGPLLTAFENLFLWAENPLPPGADMSSLNASLTPGNSQQIELQVNAAGVPGGTHTGYIRVRSNDPQNPSYEIPVILNVSPAPCAAFNYSIENCTQNVLFRDVTVNALSSWYWQFGDGGESFQQNPQHNYVAGGTYTVSMVGCNAYGCDTIVNAVEVPEANGPLPIACQPQTLSYCCQTGIYQVNLNTLQQSTSDGQAGYQDFSCTAGTLLVSGEQYPIAVITGPSYSENVRVWIDYNNNGVFNANELVFADNAYQNHGGFVTIPGSAVKNTRLRMRVSSDANTIPSACSNVSNGQVEDYWVEIRTTIATHEPDVRLKMSLFPNPSSGNVWLKLEQAQTETCLVEIHDAAGKLCWSDEVMPNGEAILLPALPQGTYFVKVQSEQAVKLERLIVME